MKIWMFFLVIEKNNISRKKKEYEEKLYLKQKNVKSIK